MKLVAQTLLTNKTGRDRHVTWAGVCLKPKEDRLVEGLYPSACKTPSDMKTMAADIEAGVVGVVLVTNLPVAKPDAAKRDSSKKPKNAAKGLRGTEPTTVIPGEDTRTAMSDVGKEVDKGVFKKGSIEDAAPQTAELKQQEGDNELKIMQPETKAIFGDDPSGTTVGDDPLQQLGKIPAPEVTRGAAELINEHGLTDAQMAKLTENGSVAKVTQPVVKRFLKQEGLINDGGGSGSDNDGNAEVATAGAAAEGPDPNSFD